MYFTIKNKVRYILMGFIFFIVSNSFSQNLIYNGDFEIHDTCPNGQGQITYAPNWYSATGTPDYFNSCISYTNVISMPFNALGYEKDYKNQNAYAGLYTFNRAFPNNGREYIGTKLLDTLKVNKKYLGTFYTNQCNNWNYAVASIGAYFTNGSILPTYPEFINVFNPQINNTILLKDTVNWLMVQDTFIAHGGETYLTIGNFSYDSLSDTLRVYNMGSGHNNDYAYYYIDGVSVYDVTSGVCNNYWDAGFDKYIFAGDSIRLGAINTDNSNYTWINSISGATYLSSNTDSRPWSTPSVTTTYYVTKICPNNNVFIDTVTVYVQSTVGINEIKNITNNFDAQVYPNPNIGKEVFINTTGLANGNINVKLTDLEGRTVYESDNNISVGTTNFKLTEIKKGVYFVHITNKTTGERIIKKLVIQY